jgi:hypothetical protein
MTKLEFPPDCPFTPAARRQMQADHDATEEQETAKDYREQSITDLTRRVAHLERRIVKMVPKDLIFEAVGIALGKARKEIDALVVAVRDEFRAIDARIDQLEAHGVKYVGTFEQGRVYVPGEIVTDRGSMWACLRETTGRPPSDSWQLSAKGEKRARTGTRG